MRRALRSAQNRGDLCLSADRIGKWFMYLLRGRFLHADIISSPEIPIRMPLVGTRGPEEFLLTRTSLINHALYGLGLALWTSIVTPLLSALSNGPSGMKGPTDLKLDPSSSTVQLLPCRFKSGQREQSCHPLPSSYDAVPCPVGQRRGHRIASVAC